MVEWLVLILPVLIGVLVFFAPVPEAGKKFSMKWRAVISILAVMTAALACKERRDNAQERRHLVSELTELRTVAPLRKESADLAKEILDFYNGRQHYMDRFKPGQGLSRTEAESTLKWYSETVTLYDAYYEPRIVSILDEIHVATGMDVRSLQSDAKVVKYAPGVEQIGTRLTALSASLP